MHTTHETGAVSVNTQNIFPIIKKFLYSDQEVFLRELVSNAVDATSKLKQLADMGLYEGEVQEAQVRVIINEANKTLTISDDGIGMSASEVKQYINQIAFSGATDFVEKHKEQGAKQDLIGFFGLGFYAAFMVADRVEIVTRSYRKDEEAVHWRCDGSTNFEMTPGVRKAVGTDVILHITSEASEYLKPDRIETLLQKYCKFLPVPIVFEQKQINDATPIWTKSPQALTADDYRSFYKKLYPFAPEPLFWIHLNVDHPFRLTGVLYFPKWDKSSPSQPATIQLYAKQVFITQDVQGIVPEFLTLLCGVLDSPDVPLNVSRSALQMDTHVRKMSAHIVKKIADKLSELFQQDRKVYEEKWAGMAPYIKYGALTDASFFEKVQPHLLFEQAQGGYTTFEAYRSNVSAKQTDSSGQLVVPYATDADAQDAAVQACLNQGYEPLVFSDPIDPHLISFLEHKLEKVQFKGVDTAPADQLIQKDEKPTSSLSDQAQQKVLDMYQQVLGKDKATRWVVAETTAEGLPLALFVDEWHKRAASVSTADKASALAVPTCAVVSATHPFTQQLLVSDATTMKEHILQAHRLALLAQNQLAGAEKTRFLHYSAALLAERSS